MNVVDLMRLLPESEHPHGLPDREFDTIFTDDRPVKGDVGGPVGVGRPPRAVDARNAPPLAQSQFGDLGQRRVSA